MCNLIFLIYAYATNTRTYNNNRSPVRAAISLSDASVFKQFLDYEMIF